MDKPSLRSEDKFSKYDNVMLVSDFPYDAFCETLPRIIKSAEAYCETGKFK